MIDFWCDLADACVKEQAQKVHPLDDFEDTDEREPDMPLGVKEGMERYKNIVRLLTTTRNVSLFPYQMAIAKDCIHNSLAKIYGSSTFDKYKDTILEMHRQDKETNELFVSSARRVGKSLTVSLCFMSILLSVPGHASGRPFTMAVFSVTKESSKCFIKECIIHLNNLDRDYLKQFEINCYTETIVVINRRNRRDVRIMRGLCGKGNVSTS